MHTTRTQRLASALRTWSMLPQALAHQVGWWACVLWMGWLGPLIMGVFILLHLGICRKQLRVELTLIASATVIGIVLDNALGALGAVTYVGTITVGYSPLWLVSIWAGFGATLKHSQAILVRTTRHAALTGLLGGPAAYWGGENLSRLDVTGGFGWLAVSFTWALALLILQKIAHQFKT